MIKNVKSSKLGSGVAKKTKSSMWASQDGESMGTGTYEIPFSPSTAISLNNIQPSDTIIFKLLKSFNL